jgi:hypothetical protein
MDVLDIYTNISGKFLKDDWVKIFTAIEKLAKDNPDLPDLLMKLAELKEKKPLVYKIAVAKLKKM